MKKETTIYLYFGLFIVGTILPYYEFIQFISIHGLNFEVFLKQITVNHISRFFLYDVLISAGVLFVFIYQQNKKFTRYWIPIVLTFTVGVSSGFPFLLYQLEKEKKKEK